MEHAAFDIVKDALTLNEATYMCGQYQHMLGEKVATGKGEAIVVCVAVAPADDINKWIFLQRFIETADAAGALEFYKVPYYDVVLIAQAGGAPLSCISLRQSRIPEAS